MSKQSEVYKLKLLNTQLKDRIQKFESEAERSSAAIQVDDVLSRFQRL